MSGVQTCALPICSSSGYLSNNQSIASSRSHSVCTVASEVENEHFGDNHISSINANNYNNFNNHYYHLNGSHDCDNKCYNDNNVNINNNNYHNDNGNNNNNNNYHNNDNNNDIQNDNFAKSEFSHFLPVSKYEFEVESVDQINDANSSNLGLIFQKSPKSKIKTANQFSGKMIGGVVLNDSDNLLEKCENLIDAASDLVQVSAEKDGQSEDQIRQINDKMIPNNDDNNNNNIEYNYDAKEVERREITIIGSPLDISKINKHSTINRGIGSGTGIGSGIRLVPGSGSGSGVGSVVRNRMGSICNENDINISAAAILGLKVKKYESLLLYLISSFLPLDRKSVV